MFNENDTFEDFGDLPPDATRETRRLMVKLSDLEVDDRTATHLRLGPEIRAAEREVDEEKERAKAAVKAREARVAVLRALQDTAGEAARSGEEPRDAEVYVVVDRRKRERLVVRGDTFRVIERRAAYESEVDAGCAWVTDLEKGVARFVHTATGVEVRTRLLTAEERQTTLDLAAPREMVWIYGAVWVNLTADEVEQLECPVPKGTRLEWQRSGEWRFTAAPVGATLDGLYHQLAVIGIAFKSGNDAPAKLADLVRRKADEEAKAASGDGKVTGIGKKRAAAKTDPAAG